MSTINIKFIPSFVIQCTNLKSLSFWQILPRDQFSFFLTMCEDHLNRTLKTREKNKTGLSPCRYRAVLRLSSVSVSVYNGLFILRFPHTMDILNLRLWMVMSLNGNTQIINKQPPYCKIQKCRGTGMEESLRNLSFG